MRRTLLPLVLLAACGGSSKPGPTPPTVAPATPTCRAIVDKMFALQGQSMFADQEPARRDELKARLADAVTAACVEDRWPEAMLVCADKAADGPSLDDCGKQLDEDRQRKVSERIGPIMKDAVAARTTSAPERQPTDGGTAIPECDAYIATFERYMACDKVPAQARAASGQSLAAMRAGWDEMRDPDVPVEAKVAAANACRQGEEALHDSAAALGCSLDDEASGKKAPSKPRNAKAMK